MARPRNFVNPRKRMVYANIVTIFFFCKKIKEFSLSLNRFNNWEDGLLFNSKHSLNPV